jgi:hypothetical protein
VRSGHSYSLLRAEGRTIERPCLIIANHFFVTPDCSKKRHRVSLVTSETFFCFAGVWDPETADWPASFAALTVDSSPDIAPLKDRHMAVVRPGDWQDWLRQSRRPEEILRPFPPGSFNVVPPHGKSVGDPPVLYAQAVVETVKIGLKRFRTVLGRNTIANVDVVTDVNHHNDHPHFAAELERARLDDGRFRGVNRIVRLDSAASRLLQLADVVAYARKWIVAEELNAQGLRDSYGIEIL